MVRSSGRTPPWPCERAAGRRRNRCRNRCRLTRPTGPTRAPPRPGGTHRCGTRVGSGALSVTGGERAVPESPGETDGVQRAQCVRRRGEGAAASLGVADPVLRGAVRGAAELLDGPSSARAARAGRAAHRPVRRRLGRVFAVTLAVGIIGGSNSCPGRTPGQVPDHRPALRHRRARPSRAPDQTRAMSGAHAAHGRILAAPTPLTSRYGPGGHRLVRPLARAAVRHVRPGPAEPGRTESPMPTAPEPEPEPSLPRR